MRRRRLQSTATAVPGRRITAAESTRLRRPRPFLRRALGRLAVTASVLVIGFLACSHPATHEPPTVEADGEHLAGAYVGDGSTKAVFLGIPYAAPPVGDRRWKPPAPITPRQGVQPATEFAPACVQGTNENSFLSYIARTLGQDPSRVPVVSSVSEDCLYLNVWTPNLGGEEFAPVMVWIHGGANVAGSASGPIHNGANLASKGVVVVTINYRLNVFGLFAHPALTAESEHGSSGNYTLLDQIAALEWVQRNIASFGGDPDRVTVFGESAGGADINYLLTSPLADGLFHRAVIESVGFAVANFRSLGEAEAVGESVAEALGVTGSEDVLAAMRALSPDELLRTWFSIKRIGISNPNVDGWVLPDAPARILDRGEHIRVPLIIGFNTDEWTTLRQYWPNVTVDAFSQWLRTIDGPLAERVIELYPVATDAEAVPASDRLQTDWYFACPSKFTANRMARAGDPVHFYEFSRTVKAPGGDLLGAYHAAEVPFVWDNLAVETWAPRQPYDQELADTISAAWVRFAATGDPNGGDLPAWPLYDGDEEGFLQFGDTVTAGSGVRAGYCEIFEELLAKWMAGGG
ncbi:MAG: carboxylesterase family protein [Holophagae bacterium]|nr:MAG: carboxylesterase family protein [Holophagae bacterium]